MYRSIGITGATIEMSKYKSRKVRIGNEVFDSKKEAERYKQLLMLQKAGVIRDLKRQVKYILIPSQYAESTEVYKKGAKKGQRKRGKLLEKECAYIADFVYKRGSEAVVEDVKGYRGGGAYAVFVIKRKLMLEKYGIRVKEV